MIASIDLAISLCTFVSVGTSEQHQQPRQRGASKALFCYYSITAQQRSGDARFTPEHIDVQMCTHVILAFADVVNGKYIRPHNWNDLRNGHDIGMFQQCQIYRSVTFL